MAELRQITLEQVLTFKDGPVNCIKTEENVETWKKTRSWRDYSIFLHRLTDSVVDCYLPWSPEVPDPGIVKLLRLLDTLDRWIQEVPPLTTPQRFGNLAFRTWGKRLEENSDTLLREFLGEEYHPVLRFAKPYLMTSFGSFTRMDYGTGHETSFGLFLLCLTLVRFFEPVPEVERQLVLVVFLRYLRLCWKLQDVYRLEPAGSHGVWGLDDSHFLPYIFGSGELRDQTIIPVDAVLRTPLPDTNLYFMSISRIHEVKHGPFYEHSSSLHSIAAGVPNWGKVNSGLFKMYEAEVLSKRVVVQHIPLGGILEWAVYSQTTAEETGNEAMTDSQPGQVLPRGIAHPLGGSFTLPQTAGVRAPWASGRASPLPASRSGNLVGPQRFRVPAPAASRISADSTPFPGATTQGSRLGQ